MAVPTAVAPSVRSPGVYMSVNLLAGTSSPGSGQLKVLLLGTKSSAGTATADTQLSTNVAPSDVQTLAGIGTPAHLASKRLFEEYGLAAVDYAAPAVSAGVGATFTLTFASTPTIAQTFTLIVQGRTMQTTWAAGVTATTFAGTVATMIGANTAYVSVTAANGGTAVCTGTAKFVGSWANDIIVYALLSGGSGGTVDGALTVTKNMTSGTLSADPTNVLSLVTTREYAFILLCDGNVAAQIAGATNPYAKINVQIALYNSGLNALLQQQIIGFSGTPTQANTVGGIFNVGTNCLAYTNAGMSLPCEYAAAECGARLREITTDPAVNRIGMVYRAALSGPLDTVASKITATQQESALNNGVSVNDFGQDGLLFPVRPITTYATDTNANADNRLLDVSRVDGTYAVARDHRTRIPQLFKGKKIVKTIGAGQELPLNTVTEAIVRTASINIVRYWVPQGVVQGVPLEAAIADGSYIVIVDPTDSSQVDFVIPLKIVPPLAKFSQVVNHVGP